MERAIFNRATLLLGEEAIKKIGEQRIIIFGVGGVGSWCAEALIRSGIKHLTIVDSDRVCVTNINRQLMATTSTVGMVKVDALKERLLSINPKAQIDAIQQIYCQDTANSFNLNEYDYIIDCIDSLKDKALLILNATKAPGRFISSMGAALKIDPTKVEVAEFWKVRGCPLARALRQKFKRSKVFPSKKFICVFSEELLKNKGAASACGTDKCICPKTKEGPGDKALLNHEWCSSKAQINGSLMHITAIFGLTIAGLVLKDLQ